MKNIFITGATGFFAPYLLRLLLANDDNQIYALVKAKDSKSVLRHKNTLIKKLFPKSVPSEMSSRIHIVLGDISKGNLSLNKKDLDKLRRVINTVYHFAAICEFGYDLDAIRKVNVRGAEHLLKLALDWKRRGSLENFNHISTVYVAGDYRGRFYERDVDVSQSFNNTYEQSKFEAELAVSRYRKMGLTVDIYRPSIITDMIPPATDTMPGLLQLLAVFVLGIFKKIPADNNTELNIIPVDVASKAIYLISTTEERLPNQNYHIVNPRPIKLGILLNAASDFFGFKKPGCIPSTRFHMNELSLVQRKIIGSFIPYLNQKLSFDTKNTTSILKRYKFNIPSIRKGDLIKTFKYYSFIRSNRRKGQLCY